MQGCFFAAEKSEKETKHAKKRKRILKKILKKEQKREKKEPARIDSWFNVEKVFR